MKMNLVLKRISPLLTVCLWAGCGGAPETTGSQGATLPPPSEAAVAMLAKADLADGTEDHVVSKCLTCSLGMDGKSAHASTFGEYELHLCSAACQKSFASDPESAVLKVKLPDAAE